MHYSEAAEVLLMIEALEGGGGGGEGFAGQGTYIHSPRGLFSADPLQGCMLSSPKLCLLRRGASNNQIQKTGLQEDFLAKMLARF